jgi:hypothetical protein
MSINPILEIIYKTPNNTTTDGGTSELLNKVWLKLEQFAHRDLLHVETHADACELVVRFKYWPAFHLDMTYAYEIVHLLNGSRDSYQTAVEVVNLEKQDFEDAKVWTKM